MEETVEKKEDVVEKKEEPVEKKEEDNNSLVKEHTNVIPEQSLVEEAKFTLRGALPWLIAILCIGAVIAFFLVGFCGKCDDSLSKIMIGDEQAKLNVDLQLKSIFPQQPYNIEWVGLTSGVYKFKVNVIAMNQTQSYDSYITIDGKLFFPVVLDIAKVIPNVQETSN
jgi:hypothetical protein